MIRFRFTKIAPPTGPANHSMPFRHQRTVSGEGKRLSIGWRGSINRANGENGAIGEDTEKV